MKSPIQQYYDLETNGKIHWCWDGGFHIYIDHRPEGHHKYEYHVNTWQEVEKIFKDKLKEINND